MSEAAPHHKPINRRELTVGAIVLGVLLTFVFTAANIFLGLRVGLTFATSIPAAVISMAVLRALGGSGVLENNITQTIASAAGTLASIIFVMPGLVMIGWWADFPFWQSFLICATGGLLGVMFSIPLRRALVTGSDLPFPEGCAAAEVLEVGSADGDEGSPAESRAGLAAILWGSAVSAFYALLTAMRLAADEAAVWWRVGPSATGIDFGLSFALAGVGHLVGLSVGMALLFGLVLGFFVFTPLLSWLHPMPGSPAADLALGTWSHDVRFIGAGVIGVAALWSLGMLVAPIVRGLREAAASSKARKGATTDLPVEEQDMPLPIVGAITAALLVPIAGLLWQFSHVGPVAPAQWTLTIGGTVFVYIASVITASVCGYMAGLIGASNSPVSGLGILSVLGAALLLAIAVAPQLPMTASQQLVAFALFSTSIVFAAATIANDNLQDLKTGQLIGATPWKQQAALMIGVIAGAATIAPVLNLLGQAYGFGAPSAAHPTPLPAPQAVLLSTLAKGVLAHDLDWGLIGIGAVIGIVLIALDGALGRAGKLRLPPLAIGIGIYLPMSATAAVVVGAVIGHLWEKRHASPAQKRIGVLMASGLIVGESIFGVIHAIPISITQNPKPLAVVGDAFATPATIGGALLYAVLLWLSYRKVSRLGSTFV